MEDLFSHGDGGKKKGVDIDTFLMAMGYDSYIGAVNFHKTTGKDMKECRKLVSHLFLLYGNAMHTNDGGRPLINVEHISKEVDALLK